MAHIPYTYTPIKSSGKKTVVHLPAPGGVSLSEDSERASSGKCLHMKNFDVLTDRVATRSAQVQLFEGFSPEGTFHGINREPFCGKTLIHIGTCLYCYDGEGNEPVVLSGTLVDKDSLFCEFMSKMYIYCDRHIYSVNSLFEFAEEEPYAPVLFENVAPVLPNDKQLDVPYNMLSPRISVVYRTSEVHRFALPLAADVSRGVKIYENDAEVDVSICSIEENAAYINRSGTVDSRIVKVSYYVKNDSDIKYDDFISGCRNVISFGGDINGGTRLFFTGNEKKKGCYYKSLLQDPLFVPSDEAETIGNGSENVTGLKRMYGDMIVFTSRSVYRMAYTLTNDGPVFSVKEISSGIGCDCPDSIQLIDNRVVFLNSEKGVFIVDSTETTGEQNVKPIGKNILKGQGAGLLDNSKQNLEKAYSADFDRKYIIFVGEKAYIWDYDAVGFVDSGNYAKAQERLVWYLYDGICGEIFFETRCGLSSLTRQNVRLYGFDRSRAKTDVLCRYVSGTLEEMYPFVNKFVTDAAMMVKAEKNSSFSVSFYADGKKYYEAAFTEPEGDKQKIKLKLPKKALYGFGFEICGNGGIEIEEILFDYAVIKD